MGRARATAGVAIAACALLLSCAAAPARARVSLRCAVAGAEVTVDGVPYGLVSDYPGGAGRQLLLVPGVHRIAVHAEGARAERELSVGPEDTLAVSFELPAGKGAAAGATTTSQGAARADEPARGGAR